MILLCVLGILVFLVREAWPLFRGAREIESGSQGTAARGFDAGEEKEPPGWSAFPALAGKRPPEVAVRIRSEDEGWVAATIGPGSVRLSGQKAEGLVERTLTPFEGTVSLSGETPVRAAWDHPGKRLAVAFASGKTAVFRVDDPAAPALESEFASLPSGGGAQTTALAFLLGDSSLLVGDSSGQVAVWSPVSAGGAQGARWEALHRFPLFAAPVRTICIPSRNRCFAADSDRGDMALAHATSERVLWRRSGTGRPLAAFRLSPRADAVEYAATAGASQVVTIDNPHPEISAKILFGKVWYEGYPEPDYVWQSTGGTDEFESKFSLVPLLLGTLKGTLFSMLFAVPIALGAALYTSQFASPLVRAAVKPAVELMAAIPSVVLGFVAGLLIAPWTERNVVSAFLLFPAVPLTVLGILSGLSVLARKRGRRNLPAVWEAVGIAAGILGGIALALALAGPVERTAFGGDFRTWWTGTTSMRFDPRNTFVVAFAMGFAVLPILFTIAEDALSRVPRSLAAGALALGATPTQTALRVVLPTASPGIFSAVMVALGRAAGETMIVLMATGNTPVKSWNPFEGFRALSANIAVEMPEAPHASTLYRVLFVSGLLLFGITFLANTAAEIVRQRLRKRYAML